MTGAPFRVGVVDYGAGNIGSVLQAFAYLEQPAVICRTPADLAGCTHAALPGVGAFGEAMARLNHSGLTPALRAHAAAGKPLLGICLGMQLLLEEGTEFGRAPGLGLIAGSVVHLSTLPDAAGPCPNTGWCAVAADPRSRLHAGGDDEHYYFNHSFVCLPDDPGVVTGRVREGGFVAMIESGPVSGVQFHPEKSHLSGIHVLERFCMFR
jgi:imidazole glycerol-phosphate synthase subunit HisH